MISNSDDKCAVSRPFDHPPSCTRTSRSIQALSDFHALARTIVLCTFNIAICADYATTRAATRAVFLLRLAIVSFSLLPSCSPHGYQQTCPPQTCSACHCAPQAERGRHRACHSKEVRRLARRYGTTPLRCVLGLGRGARLEVFRANSKMVSLYV